MNLKSLLIGLVIVAGSFAISLQAMNWLWPVVIARPVLAPLPPLPAISRGSQIMAPISISLSAIRETLDRAAPRNLGGKADNPVSQILSNADINWNLTRGPIAATAEQNALALSAPLDGKLVVNGSLSSGANTPIGNALGSLLGGNVAKRIGNINIKSLNADAAIRGNIAVTARPELLGNWRIDPKLTAQVSLDNSSLTVAGAKVAVPTQVKPVIDKAVNEQIATLQQRLRNDSSLEQSVRREWSKLCRSVALPAATSGMPALWLEVRPVKAIATQPQIDTRAVNMTMGVQAETRIVTSPTSPDCPFPNTLDIVAATGKNRVAIVLPIDLPFSDVGKIIEAQLKGKTFPEDGSGPAEITVKSVSVAAAGDRLLISLLVNATEKKSFIGFGGEATVHIWGRPLLDQQQQNLRFTNLELAVESDAAFGLLGAAARTAIPYLQTALAQRASIDLRAFTANAQQKIAGVLSDFRKTADGVRVDASLASLKLANIAFDSDKLRIVAEAEGSLSVMIAAFPNL